MNDQFCNGDIYAVVDARYGRLRYLTGDDFVGRSLGLYGEWAENEIRFLGELIKPGATVLDIGGFIGTHALAFSRMVGDDGAVFTFEPQRHSYDLLKDNIDSNHLRNVTVRNVAVGAEAGTLEIPRMDLTRRLNFGGSALTARHVQETHFGADFIPVITVDSLALPRCDLIKIDVEGMESEVLRGAVGTLQRFQPVVYAECNSMDSGAKVLEAVRAADYRVFLHLADAFNAANYFGASENVFGSAKEAALLAVPATLAGFVKPGPASGWSLFELETLDDLAFALLQKPQYGNEVLRAGAAARSGGEVFQIQDVEALREELQRKTWESAQYFEVYQAAIQAGNISNGRIRETERLLDEARISEKREREARAELISAYGDLKREFEHKLAEIGQLEDALRGSKEFGQRLLAARAEDIFRHEEAMRRAEARRQEAASDMQNAERVASELRGAIDVERRRLRDYATCLSEFVQEVENLRQIFGAVAGQDEDDWSLSDRDRLRAALRSLRSELEPVQTEWVNQRAHILAEVGRLRISFDELALIKRSKIFRFARGLIFAEMRLRVARNSG